MIQQPDTLLAIDGVEHSVTVQKDPSTGHYHLRLQVGQTVREVHANTMAGAKALLIKRLNYGRALLQPSPKRAAQIGLFGDQSVMPR